MAQNVGIIASFERCLP